VDAKNADYISIDGVLFNKVMTVLIQYPAGKQDSTYTIPEGITSIGELAISGCDNLTSVSIPVSVISIGERAFSSSKSLTNISIPEGVTSIGMFAFLNCENLASVSIPASVISISNQVFQGCNSLTSVTFETGSAITRENFDTSVFPQGKNGSGNNLRTAYLNTRTGGAGTYTREDGGTNWTKQPQEERE